MITLNFNKFKNYLTFISEKDENHGKCAIELAILAFYNYIDSNCFDDLDCPLCGHKGCLSLHKFYSRNLTYYNEIDKTIVNTSITIPVLICNNCKNIKGNQKYHAILPSFILPYHIYEGSTIISSINDYLKKKKLEDILNEKRISHKLFYDWLKKILCLSFTCFYYFKRKIRS